MRDLSDLERPFGWYEAGLPAGERKKRGHFSTPPGLVEQILYACGYTPAADLSRVRVLDPACGSGNFLAGAVRCLAAFGTRAGLSQRAVGALVSRNLWGCDPDPIACFLAEMQVRTVLAEQGIARKHLPRSLHIHQADGLALPWAPCVDLLLANPPYLAAKNSDLSGYQSVQQGGQADSYLLFLRLAFQAVRPGGWIGLVLPDPVLARANAARERARLLEEYTLHHLWHLADVFTAQVGAVVIVAQKSPPQRLHQVTWIRDRWRAREGTPRLIAQTGEEQRKHKATTGVSPTHGTIPQALFGRQPASEFCYLLSQPAGRTIEQLHLHLHRQSGADRRLAPLREFVTIRRGEELGRGSSHLRQHLGSTVSEQPMQPGVGNWHPVLRGGVDIRPYREPETQWRIAHTAITKPLERYLAPKLLVVKSTNRLQATLDLKGHAVLQTLYLLHPHTQNQGDLYFFLALLNSRLLQEYVALLHTSYKWVQPQIEQHVLASLPVPLVEPEQRQAVIEGAKSLVRACSEGDPVVEWNQEITSMYEEQERAVRALYAAVLPD
ncbi:MAG: N-6 DNA methylase [Ktedonobacteraceae bacterium]|nr:N-6 DNA methylase [Ktedonobacteraceae bacterium]